MFEILITTCDFKDGGEFEIVDRESFFDNGYNAREVLAEIIYKLVIEYKSHHEVRVRYSLLHKRYNRTFTGEVLKSTQSPELIKYDIVRDLIKVANHD